MAMGPLDVAARLFDSIERKDVGAVAALYADDFAVWHNFSNAEQDKAGNLAVLEALTRSVQSLRYEIVERVLLGDRVLQRHTLRCRTPAGEDVSIPACIFVTVRDGRITRIDEYLDTAQANRLRAATGRARIR
jgi:ketosteroid isomerase-like protein